MRRGAKNLSQVMPALKSKFAARHFHSMAPNADVYNLVTLAAGADKNLTAALHLHALLHQHLLSSRNHAMKHRPSGARSRSRAGGRVLSVVKDHARLQAGLRV